MDIVLRATVVYFFLLLMLRTMGRRELGELTPFDLVVLIVVGDLVQQGTTQEDMSLVGSFLAAGTMCFWVIVLSWITYRFPRSRRVIKGHPLLIVRDGE